MGAVVLLSLSVVLPLLGMLTVVALLRDTELPRGERVLWWMLAISWTLVVGAVGATGLTALVVFLGAGL